MKNWIGRLVAGWFGPKFVRRHITTLLGLLAGLLMPHAVKYGIPTESVDAFLSSLEAILLPLALYVVGLLYDGKPETPKIINK
jgi:hypothetical protein